MDLVPPDIAAPPPPAMTLLALQRRMQKLEQQRQTLDSLVSSGMGMGMVMLDDVERWEAKAKTLREQRDELAVDLENARDSTVQSKKLDKDFGTRLQPSVNKTLLMVEQTCFEARFAIENHAQRQDHTSERDGKQQQQQQIHSTDDFEKRIQIDNTASLRLAEQRAGTLHSLTHEVANLVATQGDDVKMLTAQTNEARENVVLGLAELAEVKKREAGKHTTRGTTLTAVIGGAIGILGGPVGVAIGAAAGAAVGAAVGSSVANASRRSIAREVRDFKDKFAIHARADGSSYCLVQVFENQRWSPNVGFSSDNLMVAAGDCTKWSGEEGETIGNAANPDRPTLPPPMSSSATLVLGRDQPTEWFWETPWAVDVTAPDSDVAGWRYAFSFSVASVWSSIPLRSSLVRRRRWIRMQACLAPSASTSPLSPSSTSPPAVSFVSTPLVPLTSEAKKHAHGASALLQSSLSQSQAVLEHATFQGAMVQSVTNDVDIMHVAATHAERMNRAVNLSGVVKNFFTSTRPLQSDASLHGPVSMMVPQQQQQPMLKSGEFHGNEVSTNNNEDPLSHLQRLCSEHLMVSEALNHEVEVQNAKLDKLNDATVTVKAGIGGVLKKM